MLSRKTGKFSKREGEVFVPGLLPARLPHPHLQPHSSEAKIDTQTGATIDTCCLSLSSQLQGRILPGRHRASFLILLSPILESGVEDAGAWCSEETEPTHLAVLPQPIRRTQLLQWALHSRAPPAAKSSLGDPRLGNTAYMTE